MARTIYFNRCLQHGLPQNRSLDSCDILNITKSEIILQEQSDLIEVMDHPSASILDLPNEVLSMIFSYCNANELLQDLSFVCARFQSIILDDKSIWKSTYFTHDMNCNGNHTLHYIVSKAPGIHCIRLKHPGGLCDMSVLNVIKYIISKHNNMHTLELECHEPALGYSELFIKGLLEGCGSTLQHLKMQGTLHQTAISSLLQFSVISTLELSDVYSFTGSDLRKMSDLCPSLKWLSIPKSSYIRDGDLSYFIQRKHSKLLGLDLNGYMLSDDSLANLCKAPRLIHLSIRDGRNLNWGTFFALKTLKKLRFLRLRRLRVCSVTVTSWIIGSCNLHMLYFIDLMDSYLLDDHVPLIIAFSCPQLQFLYMGHTFKMSERVLALITKNYPKLVFS